jgi:enoyl-CoA hydratase/carnithine racemase
MQLTQHVSYELADRIARVTLTRPEARNAAPAPDWDYVFIAGAELDAKLESPL